MVQVDLRLTAVSAKTEPFLFAQRDDAVWYIPESVKTTGFPFELPICATPPDPACSLREQQDGLQKLIIGAGQLPAPALEKDTHDNALSTHAHERRDACKVTRARGV